MPHVMRYVARIKPDRMRAIAAATGSGDDAPGDVERLIASLALPQHIAAYGIGEPELRIAAHELAGRFPEPELLQIYLAAL
jgi:alcohol dehydrogenase class IV